MQIREALPGEHARLGALVADAYAALPGMPGPDEQPAYYAMLRDAAARARNPAIHVLAAVDELGALCGVVDFIDDLAHYGAGDVARIANACGIRLLAVAPEHRGRGLGELLTRECLARARALGRAQVILHTTRAMRTAWALYERLGFTRAPELDFRQQTLDVFGFRLAITGSA